MFMFIICELILFVAHVWVYWHLFSWCESKGIPIWKALVTVLCLVFGFALLGLLIVGDVVLSGAAIYLLVKKFIEGRRHG